MKNTKIISRLAALIIAAGMLCCFAACSAYVDNDGSSEEIMQSEQTGDNQADGDQTTAEASDSDSTEQSTEEADVLALPADGTEFIHALLIEGGEETVTCQYITSDMGFAVAYDHEFFEHSTGDDSEMGKYLTIYSVYDDIAGISNYTIFTQRDTADISDLTAAFNSTECEDIMLADRMCKLYSCHGDIDSEDTVSDFYVIPMNENFLVAQLHYTMESAEGFGVRMTAMLDSLIIAE